MPTIKEFNTVYSGYLRDSLITAEDVRESLPTMRDVIRDIERKLVPTEYLMGVQKGNRAHVGFDIRDTAIGAMITIGDDGSGKNNLSTEIAIQADSRGVPVSIFTSKKFDWHLKISDSTRYHELHGNTKLNILEDLVRHIHTPKDKRIHPTQIVVIDSLPLALDWLERHGKDDDENYLEKLQTVLEKGRENGIMTIASMNTDLYSRNVELMDRWMHYFPERIFGTTIFENIGSKLGDQSSYSLESFIKGVDFRWVHPTVQGPKSTDFWIPRLR